MGKKKAVFLTAMADEDQKTASGANASFDLMADYLGWEIVGRLNVGGCSTADDLHEEDLTAAYELGKRYDRPASLFHLPRSFLITAPRSRPIRRP